VGGALLLRLLFATLRLRVHDPHGFLAAPPGTPVIYAFWHNRILAITAAFRRVYPTGRRGLLVLTSPSKDGMWLGVGRRTPRHGFGARFKFPARRHRHA
jgi:Uncharacterized protein conserved in bacteria